MSPPVQFSGNPPLTPGHPISREAIALSFTTGFPGANVVIKNILDYLPEAPFLCAP